MQFGFTNILHRMCLRTVPDRLAGFDRCRLGFSVSCGELYCSTADCADQMVWMRMHLSFGSRFHPDFNDAHLFVVEDHFECIGVRLRRVLSLGDRESRHRYADDCDKFLHACFSLVERSCAAIATASKRKLFPSGAPVHYGLRRARPTVARLSRTLCCVVRGTDIASQASRFIFERTEAKV